MSALPDSAREVLSSDALAHMVTLNPDGSPQVTCVWVGLDGDEIVSGHLSRYRKIANIENDPRVSYSIETKKVGDNGLIEYLIVYGKARITEGGAPELLRRLGHVYLGPEIDYPPIDDPPPGLVIRTEVERVAGNGPWAR